MTKKPLFYKIYFSVVALFLVVLTVALFSLHSWLKSYEAAQPINLINNIIENHLKAGDIAYLQKNCGLEISPYETDNNLNTFVENEISGKTLAAVVSAKRPDGCDAAYTVKANDKKLLNIYLKKESGATSFLPTYAVLNSELDNSFYKSISITMPQNAEITVNGISLDNKLRKNGEISEFTKKYLDGEKTEKPQTATIEKLLSDNVTVTAKLDGKETDVSKNDNTYSVHQYIDGAIKQKIQNVATGGSKAYAGYMQTDATLSDVAAYFDTSCDFYKNIRSSYTDHILEHTAAGFDNVKNDQVFKYSDNIYSCKVEFTQVLKRNGMTYKIYFDKYVFLIRSGDTFKIIDIKSPEGE